MNAASAMVERAGATDLQCLLVQGRWDRHWSEDKAFAPWRHQAQGSQDKSRDHFVPTLKRSVAERRHDG